MFFRLTERNSFKGISVRAISVLMVAIIFVITSCKDDDDVSASGKPGCQISRQTNTASGVYNGPVTYTYKSVFGYAYDDQGNVAETTVTYNYSYSDGKTANSSSSTSYQYDSEDFLLKTVRQYNSTDRDGVSNFSTGTEDLTYEKGRLVKSVNTSTDNGQVRNYAFMYEYDTDGKLVKYSNTYNNSTMTIEYAGTSIKKITYTDAVGNTNSPFLQYNEKGWLTKSIETDGSYTEEYRFEYTTEGLLAREERYINGKPSSGSMYEYDTKENPYAYVYAQRKGAPRVPSTRAEFGYKHNYTRTTSLAVNGDGTGWQNNGSAVYVYSYNDKGFPTGYTSKSIDSNGVETSTQSTTFEYVDCP